MCIFLPDITTVNHLQCICDVCCLLALMGLHFHSARNKDQKLVGRFLKIGYFYRLLIYRSIENVQEIWPTKMDFGQPNAEIGRKMANGQLLFLALLSSVSGVHTHL